jgi:hypothetical protein
MEIGTAMKAQEEVTSMEIDRKATTERGLITEMKARIK